MPTLYLEKNAETHPEYFDDTLWVSCSWQSATTYTLTYFNLQIGGDGSPTGTITLQIFVADGSQHPTGSAIATATFNVTNCDFAHGYPYLRQKFDFGAGCSIISGTTYCMQIKGSADWAYPNRPILWVTTSAAGYVQAYSTNSGASWTDIAGHAFGFQMYGYSVLLIGKNAVVTGLRHIYDRQIYNLEITFGGVSVTEPIVQDELVKMAENAVGTYDSVADRLNIINNNPTVKTKQTGVPPIPKFVPPPTKPVKPWKPAVP
jgi:hypothetical protein